MEKYTHEDIRKLGRVGRGSYCVVLPRDMVRELGWQERQKLKFVRKGKSIIIKDAK